MAAYALHVFDEQRQVGELGFHPDDDRFSFVYEPSWRASHQGYALSPHLPLHGDIPSANIRRFLENLLPEGRALDVLSIYENIQKNNIFALVRCLGKETTGALTFLMAGQTPHQLEPQVRELPAGEMHERILARERVPFAVWDGKVRISVAGFQDKLLVCKVDGRLFMVDGSLASTHIIKPEPLNGALPYMVANEHFCMRLASRLSLKRYKVDYCASAEILRMPSPVLCVRRFDRQVISDHFVEGPEGSRIPVAKRLHVIDGCQLLNLPLASKYERNLGNAPDVAHIRDGASFKLIFGAKGHMVSPALAMRQMTLWAVLTLLMGNSDAHGKNLSFFVRPEGLSVANFYDLVSVTAYDQQKIEHDLAMAFGDIFKLQEILSFPLADFCERTSIQRQYFARELRALCQLVQEEANQQAQDPTYSTEEREFVRSLADGVMQRAERFSSMAADISKYAADLY
ncbi:MAG: hypothetical protein RLZZ591_2695 [Pseudomonadota bacterium]|jgi:serine/threonine-protein kinase HipA